MVKEELIDRSPVRFFDNATNGGIGAGEVGVLTSKKGLGKTSVLVQIGLDMLLQDKQVVHVSFDQQSDSAMAWYEDIFTEISKKKNVGNAAELKAELLRKRVVLNFNQESVSGLQIVNTLKALATGGIKTDCLVIDGIDSEKLTEDAVKALKNYAKEAKVLIWFSINTNGTTLKDVLPSSIENHVDAVIHLEQKPDAIEMKVLKMKNEKITSTNLKLDSKTLLIAEK